MLKKKYGTADNFDIVINTDKGDLEAFRNRLIVDDGAVEDPSTQIEYSEAILIEPDFEVGEEVSEKVRFTDFGRRAVLAARQNLMARCRELEKRASSRSTRTAWVRSSPAKCTRSGKKMLVMDDDGNELILPKSEQIPADFSKRRRRARRGLACGDDKRYAEDRVVAHLSLFLEKLFELEVPEVFDGLITIRRSCASRASAQGGR